MKSITSPHDPLKVRNLLNIETNLLKKWYLKFRKVVHPKKAQNVLFLQIVITCLHIELLCKHIVQTASILYLPEIQKSGCDVLDHYYACI